MPKDEHFEELQLNELAPQGAIVMGGDAHALTLGNRMPETTVCGRGEPCPPKAGTDSDSS